MSIHDRPTRPAPAYAACRAAAERQLFEADLLLRERRARRLQRAMRGAEPAFCAADTLPVDPVSQAQLMRLRDSLVSPPSSVEIDVDALFQETT